MNTTWEIFWVFSATSPVKGFQGLWKGGTKEVILTAVGPTLHLSLCGNSSHEQREACVHPDAVCTHPTELSLRFHVWLELLFMLWTAGSTGVHPQLQTVTGFQIPPLPSPSGANQRLSEPQSPCLQNGDSNTHPASEPKYAAQCMARGGSTFLV